jgi:hypothetical protein
MHFEENMEANQGMENYLQGGKNGRDDEMIIFFGEGDPRAVEDRKHIKIILENHHTEMLAASALIRS